MPWFKVDDTFHGHPKLAELEHGRNFAEAIALWTVAGSWCAHHLTDGRVPSAQLRKLVPFNASRAASELVRVGLWIEAPGGYFFKDWSDYQPTRARVEADRAATAGRLARWREKNVIKNTDATREVTPAKTSRETEPVTPLPTLAPTRPDPTRPDLSPDGERVRAAAAPAHVESFERSFVQPTDAHKRVAEIVSDTRQAAGGAPWVPTGWQDRESVQKLAEWSAAPDIGPERLRAALVAFWAGKGSGARLSWLVEEDPGRFLGQPGGRRSRIAPAGTRAEHDAAVAAAGGVGSAIIEI